MIQEPEINPDLAARRDEAHVQAILAEGGHPRFREEVLADGRRRLLPGWVGPNGKPWRHLPKFAGADATKREPRMHGLLADRVLKALANADAPMSAASLWEVVNAPSHSGLDNALMRLAGRGQVVRLGAGRRRYTYTIPGRVPADAEESPRAVVVAPKRRTVRMGLALDTVPGKVAMAMGEHDWTVHRLVPRTDMDVFTVRAGVFALIERGMARRVGASKPRRGVVATYRLTTRGREALRDARAMQLAEEPPYRIAYALNLTAQQGRLVHALYAACGRWVTRQDIAELLGGQGRAVSSAVIRSQLHGVKVQVGSIIESTRVNGLRLTAGGVETVASVFAGASK